LEGEEEKERKGGSIDETMEKEEKVEKMEKVDKKIGEDRDDGEDRVSKQNVYLS
jgi:hypothetical protein